MASSSPLKDIEENFFECSLCLSLLTEPKQLPSCLHRYCKTCLRDYLKDFPQSFKCPLCKYQYDTPEEGVDEFKTDFHTKSVVEFIKLQKSLKQEEIRVCFGCQETKKVTAHCFKCKGFLCEQCHQFHLTNGMVAEHRQHILDLRSVDTKSLTLEKISSYVVAPRCSVHTENSAQLLCHSCENIPICVACIYGDHEGHAFTEVKKLARKEREDLTERLNELNRHKEKLLEFPKKVEDARENLEADITKSVRKIEMQHDHWLQRISKELNRNKDRRARKLAAMRRRQLEECSDLRLEMDREIKRLKENYEDMMKKAEDEFDNKSKPMKERYDRQEAMLLTKRAALDSECENFKEALTAQGQGNRVNLQELAKLPNDIITRCENFAATASAVLASRDHWTDAQGIPGVRLASEPLLKDVGQNLPALDTLSRIPPKDLPLVLMEDMHALEIMDDLGGWNSDYDYQPTDITSCSIHGIVYTGKRCKYGQPAGNFIVGKHIHRGGRISRHIGKPAGNREDPGPLCCALDWETAASCWTGNVRIYEIDTGDIKLTRSMKDITGFEGDAPICALAADKERGEIFLGSTSRPGEVVIANYSLEYLRSVLLPRIIKGFIDVCPNHDNLVICDHQGQEAYVVTMDPFVAKVLTKLDKPALAVKIKWRPHRVCTDNNNQIYVLWFSDHVELNQRVCAVAQYSQDGSQLLGVKRVDTAAYAICTTQAGLGRERLLVCAYTGQIYMFGILA